VACEDCTTLSADIVMTWLTRARRGALVALAALALPAALPAQAPLKVYISVDMEGIAGVATPAQTGGPDYEWGRRLMIDEANAAIAGAFEGGATEVVVNDSHGSHTNLRADLLDRRATLITGRTKPYGMAQGLDSTFAAAVFIGYHASGSMADGVLAHTYSGALTRVRVNGREVGEYGMSGIVAGHHRVPVVFMSGDRTLAAEARAFFPGATLLVVKDGIGFAAARTLHPESAREQIQSGVARAVRDRRAVRPPEVTQPVTLEIELSEVRYADAVMFVPGMERVDARTIRYRAPDALVAYRVSRLVSMLARD
jgi:D-amino peptidase